MSEEMAQGSAVTPEQRKEALVERVFGSAIGFMELLSIYVGERLGLYRALADGGAATAPELAAATGTDERYAREWLEQQAVAGILEVEDQRAEPEARRYRLPEGHDEALLERDSLLLRGTVRADDGGHNASATSSAGGVQDGQRRALPGVRRGHAPGHCLRQPADVRKPHG